MFSLSVKVARCPSPVLFESSVFYIMLVLRNMPGVIGQQVEGNRGVPGKEV